MRKRKKIWTSREIGARVKNRRRELGISQENLAEILDVTYQQVQRYENGANRLNVENIQAIAEALETPVSYFFEDTAPVLRDNMVAEEAAPYVSKTTEETRLLRYFRKIRNKSSKGVVVQVARLAARGDP